MKLLMLSALCVFSICAFSQLPNNKNYQFRDSLKNFKGNNGGVVPKQPGGYLNRIKVQNRLLANRQGNVAILPQDKMPCIVPDSVSISKIPNAWSGKALPYTPQFHPIPNPALPQNQSFQLEPGNNSLGSQAK